MVSPHVDKWLKLDTVVRNVSADSELSGDEITVTTGTVDLPPVFFAFDSHKWREYLEVIRPDDYIIAEGQIRRIEGFGLFLSDCKLFNIRRGSETMFRADTSGLTSSAQVNKQPSAPRAVDN